MLICQLDKEQLNNTTFYKPNFSTPTRPYHSLQASHIYMYIHTICTYLHIKNLNLSCEDQTTACHNFLHHQSHTLGGAERCEEGEGKGCYPDLLHSLPLFLIHNFHNRLNWQHCDHLTLLENLWPFLAYSTRVLWEKQTSPCAHMGYVLNIYFQTPILQWCVSLPVLLARCLCPRQGPKWAEAMHTSQARCCFMLLLLVCLEHCKRTQRVLSSLRDHYCVPLWETQSLNQNIT